MEWYAVCSCYWLTHSSFLVVLVQAWQFFFGGYSIQSDEKPMTIAAVATTNATAEKRIILCRARVRPARGESLFFFVRIVRLTPHHVCMPGRDL